MLGYVFGWMIGAAIVGLLTSLVFQLAAIREAVEYLAESRRRDGSAKELAREWMLATLKRNERPPAPRKEIKFECCGFEKTNEDLAIRTEVSKE